MNQALQSRVVLRPERVAVVRRGVAPEVLGDVAALSVRGGERLTGDARFSVGYKSPERVGVVLRSGERKRIEDAQVVLVSGGQETNERGEFEQYELADMLAKGLDASGVFAAPGGNIEYRDELEEYARKMSVLSFPQADGTELDDLARYQILHRDAKDVWQKELPFSRFLPPSAFTQMIGNRKLITADGQPTTVLQWLGDTHETTTLQFSMGITLPSVVDSGIGAVYRPFALAQFGTLGALEEMEIDIGFGGTQFTVAGNVATIRLGLEKPGPIQVGSAVAGAQGAVVFQYPVADASYQPSTPGPSSPLPRLNMYGMLSFNQGQRTTPITRTRYIDNLPDGGYVTFTVPKFATQIFPPLFIDHTGANLGGTLQLVYLDFQGNRIGILQVTAQTMVLAPAPVPGDAAFVRVVNATGGGKALDGRLVFALQL